MQQSFVILWLFFPADFQGPKTVVPGVGALYYPAPGRMSATRQRRRFRFPAPPPMGNMQPIAQATGNSIHFFIIVPFISTKMTHDQLPALIPPRAPNDQLSQCRFRALIIRNVGPRERQGQRYTPAIDQHMPLTARLGAIGRVFPGFFASQGSGNDRAIQNLPVPADPATLVIRPQLIRPDLFEDTIGLPFLKPLMASAARTELARNCFPLATCSQPIENTPQHPSKGNHWPRTTLRRWFRWQVFQEHDPQFIRHPAIDIDPLLLLPGGFGGATPDFSRMGMGHTMAPPEAIVTHF